MINAMEANNLMPSTQEFQLYYDKYMNMIEEKIIEAAKRDLRSITIRIPQRLKYNIVAALEKAYYECDAGEPEMYDDEYTCLLTIFWGV